MNRKIPALLLAVTLGCVRLSGQTEPASSKSSAAASGMALAPYLQVLSPESVAILWQTAQPAYGWVEYGETKELGKKQDAVVNGLRVANVTEHRVVLAGLRPGATFWYRVAFKPITFFGPYQVDFEPEQRSEVAAFQTLPAAQQKVVAVIFNDLHNREATFRALRQVVGGTPFDFSIFNGDCLADPTNRISTLATLAVYTGGIRAESRPAIFLRGNHETRGAFARDLAAWFGWPGNKPYFAFTAGPARFLVLDCGEDKPDDNREYFGLADFSSFRREETDWLKTELASPAFRAATWHVLVHHIPLYRASTDRDGSNYSKVCQELWGDLLAKAGMDIALNGHTHRMAFHPANTIGSPYPIVIGGGPTTNGATVMMLEADSRRLRLRTLNADGKEVLPIFEKTK